MEYLATLKDSPARLPGANKAMISAARAGNVKAMRLASKYGADNFHDARLYAARKGHLKAFKLATEMHSTSFYKRVMQTMYDELRTIQEAEEDDIKSFCREATKNNHWHIIRFIWDSVDNDGAATFSDIVYAAAVCGKLEVVKHMVEDYKQFSKDDAAEMHQHAAEYGHIVVLRYLEEKFSVLAGRSILAELEFNDAVRAGTARTVAHLLDRHVFNVNKALSIAVTTNRVKVARLLIANGAEVSLTDRDLAAINGCEGVHRLLMKHLPKL